MNFNLLFTHFELTTLLTLVTISLIGGAVRGFAGFGAGLIIMPVASAIIDPKLAVAAFIIIDFLVTLPLVPPAMKKCDWRSISPALIGAILTVPLGTYVLVHSNPQNVRWGISIVIILMLGLLLSGWRYKSAPNTLASVSVGGVAGFLSGLAQIPGPPVVTYWMSGPFPINIIRANSIVFFFFEAILASGAYLFSGLFTGEVLNLIILIVPAYAIAIWIGAKLHGHATEKSFRTVAYILITIAALTSLPALDWLLRGTG